MKNNWPGIVTVYLTGLVQGIGFTTIPAAANFILSPKGFQLSAEQYGSIFLPMIAGSILSSLFGGMLAEKYGTKLLLIAAGILNVISMLLFASISLIHTPDSIFPLLLATMGLLGAGFGANITALNPYAVHFFPERASVAVTALHTCLGIGTAIGPLLWNMFILKNFWQADPVLIAAAYLALLIMAWAFLPLKTPIAHSETSSNQAPLPRSALWPFALAAFLYGIVETTFGNWSTVFLNEGKHFSQELSNQALSIFWAAVTLGRLLTALIAYKISPVAIYRTLPIIILLSLGLIYGINSGTSALIAFGVAGLGCSAFLPLTISFTEKRFYLDAAFASGLLIAAYMTGYGTAAQGVGYLHREAALSWEHVYLWLSLPVVVLYGLCIYRTKVL